MLPQLAAQPWLSYTQHSNQCKLLLVSACVPAGVLCWWVTAQGGTTKGRSSTLAAKVELPTENWLT